MKQLFSNYIEKNYSISLKELALLKAYQEFEFTNGDSFKDEFNLDRASLLEELERDLLLHRGYSIGVVVELNFTIAYVLDGLVEEYANKILENLNSL